MRARLISTAVMIGLTVAACGGSGDGAQGQVADLLLEQVAEDDLSVDEGCVRDAVAELSDADAELIVEAGIDGDPEGLSEEAELVGEKVFSCLDTDSVVNQMIDSMVDDMGAENVDADCLRDAAEGLSAEEINSEEFFAATFECVGLGG